MINEEEILAKFRHLIDVGTVLVDGFTRTEITTFAVHQYICGQCDVLEMGGLVLADEEVRAEFIATMRRVADKLVEEVPKPRP